MTGAPRMIASTAKYTGLRTKRETPATTSVGVGATRARVECIASPLMSGHARGVCSSEANGSREHSRVGEVFTVLVPVRELDDTVGDHELRRQEERIVDGCPFRVVPRGRQFHTSRQFARE